ncbi:Ribosome biogenesis protein Noc4 [Mycena indigotica]|uniref:Ribosome biogenesis protein Noc4 n=1 Tax=Mycena indigotica TaxID=2126181 RepID=A0A8H6W4T0_9AGAR|nr:Ribosome biogenesis protein Noc4 [Mycena indigotica]KAF7299244.1 Ribosome biogenesis protein Noc4 [Mycena indigotica]
MAPSSLPPPAKKRKIQKHSDFVESVKAIEDQIVAAATANGSLNPLADLLELALEAKDAQDVSKAIYSLYRVFVVVVSGGKLNSGGDEAAKIVRAWIWERLNVYVDFLCGLLKDEEKTLRISALQILFSLQKHLSTAATASEGQPQFHINHFRKIVSAVLLCPPSSRLAQSSTGFLDADVLHSFHETWFSVHDDVRWFFLREAGTMLSSLTAEFAPQNLLSVLEGLATFPTEKAEINAWWVTELAAKPPKPKSSKNAESDDDDEDEPLEQDDDWRKFFDEDSSAKEKLSTKKSATRLHKLSTHQSLHSLQSHRAVFTRAWLTLLPRLSAIHDKMAKKGLLQRALNVMHRGVMPHLSRPVLIMDWVGGSVDYGGTVGLLALNALFMLMKDYNLDYPSFYTKLYAFLDRDVLHSKHRARFFRLTELFLSSTHLPAALVASFIKRLARLSLAAPPAAIVLILPFTYNALKRHPALMPMIHRHADADSTTDVFDAAEPNPNLTHAIDSSLWELSSHRSHWLAGVSTMSRILEEAFTKQSYAMEDFLDHTYGTLFDADANRKIKKEPPVAMDMTKGLFGNEGVEGDVVSELWSF